MIVPPGMDKIKEIALGLEDEIETLEKKIGK